MKIVERLKIDDINEWCWVKLHNQSWAENGPLLRGYFAWTHQRVHGAHLVSYVKTSLRETRRGSAR